MEQRTADQQRTADRQTADRKVQREEEREVSALPAFVQRLYENGYFRQEELVFRECDRNKRVRVGSLLAKMAAFAGYDYDARGLTHERLQEMGEVFLLSRAALRIHRCPVYREVLDIHTWEDAPRGPYLRRVYELRDPSGQLCVSAKSDWILVDPASRKILRPASFTARPPHQCPKEIACPEPKKLRLPAEGQEARGVYRVLWSDLDGNGHLFSGNYGDIIWDFLPPDLRERPVEAFFINYNHEAALDDELRIALVRTEGGCILEGIGPAGTCFTAECVWKQEPQMIV